MKNKLYIIYILTLVFSVSACKHKAGNLKEGSIIYELEYLTDISKNPIITFLPSSMTYSYKGHRSIQSVEGWSGVFKMIGIADTEKDSVTALVKLIGKKMKYTYPLSEGNMSFLNIEDNILIQKADGTKTIAGYDCQKAIAIYNNQEVELYYTHEIDIENPNWNTPYSEIDGVILEYRFNMFNIDVLVTAKSVDHNAVDEQLFLIPEDYENTSKDSIFAVLNEYQ